MAGGMSLQEALEVRHAGKYDFTGRADGAKKLALDTLKQQLLTFSPAQPGEKPGAEAADAAVYRLSRKRAVIEVLRDGKGFGAFDAAPLLRAALSTRILPCWCAGPVYEEDDAMNSKEILQEIQASPDYFKTLLASGDELPDSAAEVTQIIKSCMQPLKSLDVGAPVDAIKVGKRLKFFLVQNVIDALPFPDDDDTLLGLPAPSVSRECSYTGTVAPGEAEPSMRSLAPPIPRREGSISLARGDDDVLFEQILDEGQHQQAFNDFLSESQQEREQYDRDLATAISNSEIHTHGVNVTDAYGAEPSGAS